jgi:DNA-binding transcriptional ArsR family regulator
VIVNQFLYYGAKRMATSKQRAGQRLDRVFSALAHPGRRAMLMRLTKGAATISELAEPFAMTLPAVSSHVRVLQAAGLLRRTREGRAHVCALEALPLRDARNFVLRYRAFWERQLEALARYAERGAEDGTHDDD